MTLFERMTISPLFRKKVSIVVRPLMLSVYEDITKGESEKFYLHGPPGLGKTTTLGWLFCVLKRSTEFFPVTFPLDETYETLNPVQQISQHGNRKVVILLDVISPTKKSILRLSRLLVYASNYICVLAFSSSYEVFAFSDPRRVSYLSGWIMSATGVEFNTLTNEESKFFLSSILNEQQLNSKHDAMLEISKGIPQLLAYASKGEDNVKQCLDTIIEKKYTEVIKYMVECKDYVVWKNELNLLMAARFEVDLHKFGLTIKDAKATFLFRSYLVGVSDKFVPYSHFQSARNKDNYLLSTIKSLWSQYREFTEGVSSAAVKGFFFEARFPTLLENKISVRKLQCATKCDISFNLTTTSKHLDFIGRDLPSANVLWRAPQGAPGIDYYAKIDGLHLPDDPNPGTRATIVAIQVSVQVDKHKEKVRNSITQINWDLCKDKNVIFMMVNPLWDDFEIMFDDATSGSGGRRTPHFESLWYGHFCNMEKLKAAEKSLKVIFQ